MMIITTLILYDALEMIIEDMGLPYTNSVNTYRRRRNREKSLSCVYLTYEFARILSFSHGL